MATQKGAPRNHGQAFPWGEMRDRRCGCRGKRCRYGRALETMLGVGLSLVDSGVHSRGANLSFTVCKIFLK